MKKVILSISMLFLTIGLMAQEKEINAAFSAYEAKNNAEAKAELGKISGQISSPSISPELKAKYYYVLGEIALKEGKSVEAAQHFSDLAKYESGTIYSIKNKSTKITEYYATQQEAESAAANGDFSKPKAENLKPNLLPGVQTKLKTMAENAITQGSNFLDAKKNKEAGDKFTEAYYLVKALGDDNKLIKYNAAISYHNAGEYAKAFDMYKSLIEAKYTGESTSWVGTAKDGSEITFGSKADADLQEKLGVVSRIKEVKTPSIEKDLYTNALNSLAFSKQYDNLVETASAKYPNDAKIQSLIGTVYYNSGKQDLLESKLLANIKSNPNDATNYFTLGTLYAEQGKDQEAVQYYEKTIQLDPSKKDAYTNLALVKIKAEKGYVDIINANLGTSAKEKQTYKEYNEKRKNLYKEIIPLLEKAFELDKTDYNAAKTLRQAYQAAEMFDKEDAMRAIEKSLER